MSVRILLKSTPSNDEDCVLKFEGQLFGDKREDGIVSRATLILNFRIGDRPVALIEDVWTREDYRGRGYATAVVKALLEEAKSYDAYKAVLCCADHNIDFYKKLGFNVHQNAMRIDL